MCKQSQNTPSCCVWLAFRSDNVVVCSRWWSIHSILHRRTRALNGFREVTHTHEHSTHAYHNLKIGFSLYLETLSDNSIASDGEIATLLWVFCVLFSASSNPVFSFDRVDCVLLYTNCLPNCMFLTFESRFVGSHTNGLFLFSIWNYVPSSTPSTTIAHLWKWNLLTNL